MGKAHGLACVPFYFLSTISTTSKRLACCPCERGTECSQKESVLDEYFGENKTLSAAFLSKFEDALKIRIKALKDAFPLGTGFVIRARLT